MQVVATTLLRRYKPYLIGLAVIGALAAGWYIDRSIQYKKGYKQAKTEYSELKAIADAKAQAESRLLLKMARFNEADYEEQNRELQTRLNHVNTVVTSMRNDAIARSRATNATTTDECIAQSARDGALLGEMATAGAEMAGEADRLRIKVTALQEYTQLLLAGYK